MLNLRTAIVKDILEKRNTCIEVLLDIEGNEAKGVFYTSLSGNVNIGDKVLINTTAVDLSLGTGGYHFIISNDSTVEKESEVKGHMMKLRYTPLQIKVDSIEAQESEYHNLFNEDLDLKGMPILVGSLHSMISPLALILKSMKSDIKIAYIMTDGGALPIDFSKNVKMLKEKGMIDKTITVGHAFGGDIEAINIYNGLLAAKKVAKCDVAIVAMGPGIAGTGTKYGFSGVEQGINIDAVNTLGGTAICVPRVSFKDKRDRHQGISHHILTVLTKIAKTNANLVLPSYDDYRKDVIESQLLDNNINDKHDVTFMAFNDIIELFMSSEISMETMGRGLKEDLDYFITIGLCGKYVINILKRGVENE